MKKILYCIMATVCLSGLFVAKSQAQKLVAITEVVDKKGAFEDGEKFLVRGFLTKAVTKTPGYEGYDRVDISAIMDEHEFQRSGMVSSSGIKQLGEMTGCDYILVTEMMRMGEDYIVFSAKIVNVETGRILNTGTVQGANDMADHQNSCKRLVEDMLGGL